MSGRRIAGVVCLVLAVLLLVAGQSGADHGPELADRSGLGVSRAIGSFLPALLAAIVGLWLLQKPKAG